MHQNSPSPEARQEQARRLLALLGGDAQGQQALALCDALFGISQVWDDLVDADRAVSPEAVSQAFWLALVEIPANPFWQRHQAELRPLLAAAIAAWQDANELERGPEHERTLAFVLRDMLTSVACHCAYLLGGYPWQRRVSPDVRRLLHDEPLSDYLEGLA